MATLPLKELPEDVRKYILKIQQQVKKRKGVKQYSLHQIVYQIIREHESLFCHETKNLAPKDFISQMRTTLDGMEECLCKS